MCETNTDNNKPRRVSSSLACSDVARVFPASLFQSETTLFISSVTVSGVQAYTAVSQTVVLNPEKKLIKRVISDKMTIL